MGDQMHSPCSETVLNQYTPQYYQTVLQYFRTHSTAVATVDELAGAISDQQDEAQWHIAIRLHHATLPKLADTGLVDYDTRTHTTWKPQYMGDQMHSPCSETVLNQYTPQYYQTVLQYFRTHSTAVATVDELAEAVSDQQDESQWHIAIRLHHATLPKLADTGLVDYDARTHTARYREDEQGASAPKRRRSSMDFLVCLS